MAFIVIQKDVSPSNMLPAGKCGAVFAVGDPVYLDSNGVYQKAAASLLTVANASRLSAVGFCAQITQANEVINAFRKLTISDTSATYTIGGKVFLSATAATLTQTAPGVTYVNQVLGLAVSANDLYLSVTPALSALTGAVQRTGTSTGAISLAGVSYGAEAATIQALANEMQAALAAFGLIRGT